MRLRGTLPIQQYAWLGAVGAGAGETWDKRTNCIMRYPTPAIQSTDLQHECVVEDDLWCGHLELQHLVVHSSSRLQCAQALLQVSIERPQLAAPEDDNTQQQQQQQWQRKG